MDRLSRVRALKFSVFIIFLFLVRPVSAQDSLRFQAEVNELIAGDSAVNKKSVILFTGSSSIRFWETLKSDFPNHNVINCGFGGSEMTDLINYVDKLIVPYHPKQIFIYEGDNDIGGGKEPDEILKDADRLLVSIRKQMSRKVQVLFISPKPSILRWELKGRYEAYNQKLESWTKQQKKVTFIDVWTPMLDADGNVRKDLFIEDGLHMNKKGYDIWTKVIGPYLK